MDRYEGIATLEWWANRSTRLGSYDVYVTITAAQGGWQAEAVAVNAWTADDGKDFDLLIALDPVFTLRFTDDSSVHVQVTQSCERGHLTLTAIRGD
ncbi:hypothetical protein ABIA33_003448 [Streptacidiphilus sp. MAP12-16]|uniref:hypothetical protein n=1 Tax=Streptacidiphilus sp. MAP12-16 TaxID=3156300 RepID=UPI003511861C